MLAHIITNMGAFKKIYRVVLGVEILSEDQRLLLTGGQPSPCCRRCSEPLRRQWFEEQ